MTERPLCACGCGAVTSGKISQKTGQQARYISGHHARDPRNKVAVAAGRKAGAAAGNYRKSAAWRQRASEAKKGARNPMYGKVEHMRKIAPNRGARNGNYGHSARHGKGAWYTRRDGQRIWLRSSWEYRVAEWLDRKGLTWQYECQRYFLGSTTYAPDFWIKEFGCYWEVKGWFHLRHQKTIRQFRELYPEEKVVVLTKPVLRYLFGRSFK